MIQYNETYRIRCFIPRKLPIISHIFKQFSKYDTCTPYINELIVFISFFHFRMIQLIPLQHASRTSITIGSSMSMSKLQFLILLIMQLVSPTREMVSPSVEIVLQLETLQDSSCTKSPIFQMLSSNSSRYTTDADLITTCLQSERL